MSRYGYRNSTQTLTAGMCSEDSRQGKRFRLPRQVGSWVLVYLAMAVVALCENHVSLAQQPSIRSDSSPQIAFRFLPSQAGASSESAGVRSVETAQSSPKPAFLAKLVAHQKHRVLVPLDAGLMRPEPQALAADASNSSTSNAGGRSAREPGEPAPINSTGGTQSTTQTRLVSRRTFVQAPLSSPATDNRGDGESQLAPPQSRSPRRSWLDIRPRSLEEQQAVPVTELPKDTSGLPPSMGEPQLAPLYTTDLQPADFCAAASFYHRPLYFEDYYLERYGISRGLCGRIPPVHSGISFLAHTLGLPVSMIHEPPHSCVRSGCICR